MRITMREIFIAVMVVFGLVVIIVSAGFGFVWLYRPGYYLVETTVKKTAHMVFDE